jgi:selenocysteine-specific elongation factor
MAVKNHQRIRVHIGTAERLAKLVVLGSREEIGPRGSEYCQVTLSDEVLAVRGDRFVIRDETAQKTLGGGTIIHPWAKKHKKREPGLQERLRSLHKGDLATLVAAFVNASDDFAVSITELYQFLNLREEETEERLKGLQAIHVFSFEEERLYTTEKRWSEVRDQLLKTLRAFHETHPLASGMDMEEARDRLPYRIPPRLFRAFVEQLGLERTIVRESNLLRVPGHQIRLSDDERRAVERITALLRSSALSPPDAKQIEVETGLGRAKVQEVLRLMERQQTVVRVAPDLYFLRDAVARMMTALRDYLARSNELTPGVFRDLFGTSRKYTIPLLEYLDREGFTVRVGDVRKLKQGR